MEDKLLAYCLGRFTKISCDDQIFLCIYGKLCTPWFSILLLIAGIEPNPGPENGITSPNNGTSACIECNKEFLFAMVAVSCTVGFLFVVLIFALILQLFKKCAQCLETEDSKADTSIKDTEKGSYYEYTSSMQESQKRPLHQANKDEKAEFFTVTVENEFIDDRFFSEKPLTPWQYDPTRNTKKDTSLKVPEEKQDYQPVSFKIDKNSKRRSHHQSTKDKKAGATTMHEFVSYNPISSREYEEAQGRVYDKVFEEKVEVTLDRIDYIDCKSASSKKPEELQAQLIELSEDKKVKLDMIDCIDCKTASTNTCEETQVQQCVDNKAIYSITPPVIFKIIYKSCFEHYFNKIYGQFCCCKVPQIKYKIRQITMITTEVSQYRIFDALFALYLALMAKRRSVVHNRRLMRLTDKVVPRTSSPSQADSLYKSTIAQLLRKRGSLDEAIYLAVSCIKTLNLDMRCTFNCARVLDLIRALREKFQTHSDYELLIEMMTFLEHSSAQLRDDTTILSRQLNKEVREHINFYVVQIASFLIEKDSASSSNEKLIEAIVTFNLPACRSSVNDGADFNLCLHALIQVIRSKTGILYREDNFDDDLTSTFSVKQIKVIDYIISLDVTEAIIEEGLSLFYHFCDKRREVILTSISRKLENNIDYLETSDPPPKVQYGRFVVDNIEKEGFLVFVNTNENIQNRYYAGKSMIFRNPSRISYEGINISLFSLRSNSSLSDDDCENIKETIKRESEKLWNEHTNLNIISACSIKSKQNGQITQLQPCIVLYCTCKGFIPNIEPKFPKVLPSRKGNIAVDVREGYFTLGYGTRSTDWNSPLRMGASVGLSQRLSAGTIGPFIALSRDQTGFLTCAHVFADFQQLQQNTNNNNVSINMTTVQPSDSDFTNVPNGETKLCGKVKKCMFDSSLPIGIDAAVVEITHRHPERGLFAINSELELRRAGFTSATDPIFDSGSTIECITPDNRRRPIVKFGYKTGLTIGAFELDGAQVRIKDQPFDIGDRFPCIFRGMYEIRCDINNAFREGDSGSGVFLIDKDEKTLHCVGIAIGSTSYGATIVEPIGSVLDVLFGSTRPATLKQFLLPRIEED